MLAAWGPRPARKARRSYVVPTIRSLRGASRAPLGKEKKKQGCVRRDAKHGGRDNRSPQEQDFKVFAFIRVHSRFHS